MKRKFKKVAKTKKGVPKAYLKGAKILRQEKEKYLEQEKSIYQVK
jgi:hypothetical protein